MERQQAYSRGVPENTSPGVPSSAAASATPAPSALHLPVMMPDGHSRGMVAESLWGVDHLVHGNHGYREQWQQLRVETWSSVAVGMNYWQQLTLNQLQLMIERWSSAAVEHHNWYQQMNAFSLQSQNLGTIEHDPSAAAAAGPDH